MRFWGMANNKPRPVEYMRDLGRRGGLKSGETRHEVRGRRILTKCAAQKGTGVPLDLLDPTEIWPESILKRDSRTGGSHDTDWRCRKCHHFNSIKSREVYQEAKTGIQPTWLVDLGWSLNSYAAQQLGERL